MCYSNMYTHRESCGNYWRGGGFCHFSEAWRGHQVTSKEAAGVPRVLTLFADRSTPGSIGSLNAKSVSKLGFQNNSSFLLFQPLIMPEEYSSFPISNSGHLQGAFIVKNNLCEEFCSI